MTQRFQTNYSGWQALIVMALFLIVIYFIATAFFRLLYSPLVSIGLLIATLAINHNVFINYGKWIVNLTQKNPIMGIGAGLLSFMFYPVVIFFLFGKALLYRRVNQMKTKMDTEREGEYIEYEEVASEMGNYDLLESMGKKQEELFEYWELDDKEKRR